MCLQKNVFRSWNQCVYLNVLSSVLPFQNLTSSLSKICILNSLKICFYLKIWFLYFHTKEQWMLITFRSEFYFFLFFLLRSAVFILIRLTFLAGGSWTVDNSIKWRFGAYRRYNSLSSYYLKSSQETTGTPCPRVL